MGLNIWYDKPIPLRWLGQEVVLVTSTSKVCTHFDGFRNCNFEKRKEGRNIVNLCLISGWNASHISAIYLQCCGRIHKAGKVFTFLLEHLIVFLLIQLPPLKSNVRNLIVVTVIFLNGTTLPQCSCYKLARLYFFTKIMTSSYLLLTGLWVWFRIKEVCYK